MDILKLYFRIFFKRGFGTTLMYIFIFSAICMITTALPDSAADDTFTGEKPDIGIVDLDDTPLSHGLYDYLGTHTTLHDLGVDATEKEIRESVYNGFFTYVLVIPDGFEVRFTAGGTGDVRQYTQPSTQSILVTQHTQQYLKTAALYRDTVGIQLDSIAADLALSVDATLSDADAASVQGYAYYISYLVYPLSAILLFTVIMMMLVFREPEIQKRNLCAPIRPTRLSLQLLLGNLFILVIALVPLLGIISIRFPAIFESPRWLLWFANTLVFGLLCLMLSFFLSTLCKKSMITPIANIVSLGMCFLGGVFVPLEAMSDKIKPMLVVNPAYWFVRINESIETLTDYSAESLSEIGWMVLIELAFCAAFLSLALARRPKA